MRGRMVGAAMTAVALAVLAACGSGNSGTGTAGGATSGSSAATSTSAAGGSSTQAGRPVQVKATEDRFSLPTTQFAAGTYTFVMTNEGHATHAMEIQGPGIGDQATSSSAAPGEKVSLTVTLGPGRFTLFCPIDGHRAKGMETMLSVR